MPYLQDDISRIIELVKEIEGRKEHKNAAPTYKDVPALRELDAIVDKYLSEPVDRDTLEDSIMTVRYLGNAYESMWRVAYAVKFYTRLIELEAELCRRFGETDRDFADDYYTTLRARNYYGSDDCADLTVLAREVLPEEKCRGIEKEIFDDFHPLKHDPVELTEEYLAVIDEVERRMDTDEVRKMHPFAVNDLFGKLLSEYGVKWRSLTKLNPGVHFN